MFTSRPSDPRTVLLWGDRWWFASAGASVKFQNPVQAAEVLAAHFADEPKPVRLRLIYQSDTLESVSVACPQGDRKTLATALADEFPAVANSDHAWSHEPILATETDFSTVLHFESQPGLFVLATRLARLGLAVDSVWPFGTILNAIPEEWTESGAVTVLALQGERAIAYRHSARGERTITQWRGSSTVTEVGQWLAGLLAEDNRDPVLLIPAEDQAFATLETSLPGEDLAGIQVLTLEEALDRRIILPRYHPAQLLPRPPLLTASQAMVAAGLVLLLSTAWPAYSLARQSQAIAQEAQGRAVQLTALRLEIAHLRENAAAIAILRTTVEGESATPAAAFLAAVAQTIPPTITLAELRLEGRSVRLAGWLAPTAKADAPEQWRTRLAGVAASWGLSVRPGTNGAFTLDGSLRR